MITRLLLALLVAGLAACANTPVQKAAPPAGDTVILISIDGFRADYLQRGVTPVLAGLAQRGASGPMRPSFPSVTFPNHYTLVTGLHPDRHGIVNNVMEDAAIPGVRFTLGNAAAVTDRRWWDQAEPIWVTAEKAGLTTATMFWPGSEADIGGVRPTHWARFDQSLSGDARVDRVLAWLDLAGEDRPDLVTLYFDIVDTAGHRHGPDAAEVNAAAAAVDASIGRLVAGLAARGVADRTTIIVVSDHGMAATSPERVVWLDDLVPIDAITVLYAGAVASLTPVAGREAEVEAALIRDHGGAECWRRQDIPARLAYGRNPRVSPIFCLAATGWTLASRGRAVSRGGAHGYDNAAPEMQAVFIAHGPGIARGVTLRDLDSVDVQPLLARLLGIAAPAGDGRAEDTLPVMAR